MKTKYFELTLSDDYKQYVTESELEEMIDDCLRYDGIIPFSRKEISKSEYDANRQEVENENIIESGKCAECGKETSALYSKAESYTYGVYYEGYPICQGCLTGYFEDAVTDFESTRQL